MGEGSALTWFHEASTIAPNPDTVADMYNCSVHASVNYEDFFLIFSQGILCRNAICIGTTV